MIDVYFVNEEYGNDNSYIRDKYLDMLTDFAKKYKYSNRRILESKYFFKNESEEVLDFEDFFENDGVFSTSTPMRGSVNSKRPRSYDFKFEELSSFKDIKTFLATVGETKIINETIYVLVNRKLFRKITDFSIMEEIINYIYCLLEDENAEENSR
ncbi:MAG: hypothetical protein ACRCZ2_00015 [Fusobacteriaceae bacterium]